MRFNNLSAAICLTVVSLFSNAGFYSNSLSFNETIQRRPASITRVDIKIKSTQKRYTIELQTGQYVRVLDENQDVVYAGSLKQFYIPVKGNESAISKLEKIGYKFLETHFNQSAQTKLKYGASASGQDVILLIDGKRISYIDTGFSSDLKIIPLPDDLNSKAYRDGFIKGLAVDINGYQDVVSFLYQTEQTKTQKSETFVYNVDQDSRSTIIDQYISTARFDQIEIMKLIKPRGDEIKDNHTQPKNADIKQSVKDVLSVSKNAWLSDKASKSDLLQNSTESKKSQTGMSYQDYIIKMSELMQNSVLGQPEAVEAMIDIEKDLITGGGIRKQPSVLMFIGLPGTGKDTIVESYIQSRHFVNYNKTVDLNDHIFRYPVVKESKDAWTLTGSATGYVGSKNLSPLVRFLVKHSAGKYRIVKPQDEQEQEYVVLNEEWKPGQVLPDYFAPEDAILFVNELHDWSAEQINELLKEALEKGYFKINNPGPGLNRLQVPMTFVLTSNHGIGLIASRDQNGQRVGRPLTEQELMARWELAAYDKPRLKDEIAKVSPQNSKGGMSEEVRSRIPDSRLILLRPFSSDIVAKIASAKLKQVSILFAQTKLKGMPSLQVEFSKSLVDFVANYDQSAEDAARLLDGKISQLVTKTIQDALFAQKIKFKNNEKVIVDVHHNQDGTYDLLLNGQSLPIGYTQKNKVKLSITDAEIDDLVNLESKLNEKVKGVQHIVKKLARDIRRSQNIEKVNDVEYNQKNADVYMFLGSSSTGKTELATALHQVLYKTHTKPLIIDFSQITNVQDLKDKILGSRDRQNSSIASDFMAEFDRANGDLVVVFDEISNANSEILKALYDILREPVVRTFSDKKPRSMAKVKIVMTGNAGEEWYKNIPRHIPENEQLAAARSIYEQYLANAGLRRATLLKFFSEAFINRVGEERIFYFAPHTMKTIRELVHQKLVSAIKKFSSQQNGRRSWNILFNSEQDYILTLESIEKYGFKIWEQGASIKRFIDDNLLPEIHDALLKAKVPHGETVKLIKISDVPGASQSQVHFTLNIVNQNLSIPVSVDGKGLVRKIKKTDSEIQWTAYHEAGHEVARRVLLQDSQRSGGVSIKPGVTLINGEAILYDGIARSERVESIPVTRESLINEMAILLAGEVAESITVRNGLHSAGIANDIQRATDLARNAIINYGMSSRWRSGAQPNNSDLNAYVMTLSDSKKALLEKEIEVLLDEAREKARHTLIANYDLLFLPIGRHLAAKGEIKGDVLERFYIQRQYQIIHPIQKNLVRERISEFETKVKAESALAPKSQMGLQFYNFAQRTERVVDLEQLDRKQLAQELKSVNLSSAKDVVYSSILPVSKATHTKAHKCIELFSK